MVFSYVAKDLKSNKVKKNWDCPKCGTLLSKSPSKKSGAQRVERATESVFDPSLGKTIARAKQTPIKIIYSLEGKKLEKSPDKDDFELIERIAEIDIPFAFPAIPMMNIGENWGDTWRAGIHIGISHTHHFYSKRNLYALAIIFHIIHDGNKENKNWLIFTFDQLIMGMSKWARYVPSHYSHVNQGLSGTLFIASEKVEASPEYIILNKINRLAKVLKTLRFSGKDHIVTTQSSSGNLSNKKAYVDYIFVDPPFGSNLMYSELNFLVEAWLGVMTENKTEAIVNASQHKGLLEYQIMMGECFSRYYEALKPGRWMTVEFHNSKNSVWNSIQESILRAGFIVADVRTLDKKHRTIKQINNTNAVKQDLIISAYKPKEAIEKKLQLEGANIESVWGFISQHLEYLPIPSISEEGIIENLAERLSYLLFDRMVAFHIQRGLTVPISSSEFYQGLNQRYLERDNMYFLPDQAAEYDKRRMKSERVEQLTLFVNDEKSAIQWLRQELSPKTGSGPLTYQDLQPKFIRELHKANHEDMPELLEMLEDNFLKNDTEIWYVPDPDRQADLEALREKSLIREFNEYLKSNQQLKVFRSEAIRVGFSRAWKERDYEAIVKVAERLPSNVLEEDQQLLMYVHNASLRYGQQPKQQELF